MIRVVVNDMSSYKELLFSKITPKEALKLLENKPVCAVEVKSTGPDAIYDKVKAIAISTTDKEVFIITPEVINFAFMKRLFDNRSIIVHSGLKDISFLLKYGCVIRNCWDTCLCDRVTTRTIYGELQDYSLLACLNRHSVEHNVNSFEKGLFWKEGFTVPGCSYLASRVRYLIDLKNAIIRDSKKSTLLFRQVNVSLLVSAYMNTAPIFIDEDILMANAKDRLEDLMEQESLLLDCFGALHDRPGELRDSLPFEPEVGEYYQPLYDIDDKKAIRDFFLRTASDDDWADDDDIEEYNIMKTYEDDVRYYNDVIRRYLAEAKTRACTYSHCTPAFGDTLRMKCIKNFPCPTHAKEDGISPILASSLDHFDAMVYEDFIGSASYGIELHLLEISDIRTLGLALLTGDNNLLRFVIKKDEEVGRLTEDLNVAMPSSPVTPERASRLLNDIIKACFEISEKILIGRGFAKTDLGKITGVIRKRYSVAVDSISSMLGRLNESGQVLIFDSYPLYWPDFNELKPIKVMMTQTDFWPSYQAHVQLKDDIFHKVQLYYSQTRKADKALRTAILEYAHAYVFNNLVDKVFHYLKEHDFDQMVTIKGFDDSSIIIESPDQIGPFMTDLFEDVPESLAKYFGLNELPMTITNI